MNKKTTSFFLKTSYYRSLGFILAGILMIIYSLNNLTKDIDDYPKVNGIIKNAHLRYNDAPYSINLNTKPENWYRIYYRKMFPVLKEKAVKGKKATIWYSEDHLIEQLKVEGEIIYPYSKATWLWIVLLVFGTALTVGHFIYIIKYPKHAEGKDDKLDKVNN